MSAHNQRADQGPDLFSSSPTAYHPVLQPQAETQHSLSSPSEGGMSAFPSGRTHLPTPQSPEYMGHYIQAPESPLAHASYMSYSAISRPLYGMPLQKPMNPMQGRSPQQQTMTPESSPYTPRYNQSSYSLTPAIPQFNPLSTNFSTPRASSSSTTLQSPATATKPPPRMITPPPSTPSPANLSSPFKDKLTMADKAPTSIISRLSGTPRPTSNHIPAHVDDIFSSSSSSSSAHPLSTAQQFPAASSATPPISPNPSTAPPLMLAAPTPVPGGEMERIRQAMMQNQLAQYQEAEARRPDYLKRAKRPLSASDLPAPVDEDSRPGVGIMDSPHKGRRITLFQETSDQSFEESLMAGGYGRYRTADWVRQPQPMAPTPGPAGPSTVVKRVEVPEAPRPPTEKELRKRKRLQAFRSNETTNTSDPPTSKLFPVNLEGKGRVLIDTLSEEHGLAPSAPVDPSPSKTANGGKRAMAAANKKAKKKAQEPSAREKKAMLQAAAALEDSSEKPNWPDAEFPWRLRTEERAELAKEEEEQRMQWIEKFLDRDTDEEDVSEEEEEVQKDGAEEELLSPRAWGKVYEEGAQRPIPARGGRGKMVPLSADPYAGMRDLRPLGGIKKSRFFPSDPGDALAALLAKKSVRALSFRQQRRQREQNANAGSDEEEVLCICHGKNDDEEVVQCDNCQTWYHLHCIGIRSIADLGREEDPWYCEGCVVVERSESSEDEGEQTTRAQEPTFVPTDNEPPRVSRSDDTPIFQPSALQDSPMPWSGPKTPPRGSARSTTEFGSGFSSVSASDSRHEPVTPQGPSTPQYPNRRGSVQIFSHDTPGLFDMDDAPFDPTSTPSRGIKFGFTTPKNTMWPTRPNGLFQTPSKRRDSSSRLFGGPGTLDESAGGGGVFSSPFGRMPAYDDSPIRRDTAPAGDGQRARRLLDSPIPPSVGGRYLGSAMTLEDSPVMWSMKGKERTHEAP